MSIQGWYYLHTNGSVIYKRELGGTAADIRESDFAKTLWPFDPSDRESAWRICIEGLAAGADPVRINELAALWKCDDEDAAVYADRVGCELRMDGDMRCATDRHFVNLQESPAGFGKTCLEAMAELCKELGYRPRKMWGATFPDLLNKRENARDGVGACRLTTIGQDLEGRIETRDRGPFGTLAAAMRFAERFGWVPGNISGTGLTIIETRFESVHRELSQQQNEAA